MTKPITPFFSFASKRLLTSLLLACLSLSSASYAEAISNTPGGQQTVAKFMESLARYITWPKESFSSPDSPYTYCLMGETAMYDSLSARLGSKKVKKRGFEIRQLDLADIEQGKDCHLVFLGAPGVAKLRETIAALSGSAILTTGDFKQFAAHGGMVGFVGTGNKGSLQINKKRLEGSGLKASSKLYRVSSK
ncbi:YfiR family protein [Oceanicoccus sagamiensis]|uniref:YfiR family protein n=1 Tax=Oceanicoccus sagamiensis TaxID=716816 RepID=A0A1X9NC76_9GAMM|nr:YfiR family protein [Oceanicoccus sagamiensis]ARN73505.1 hypothetical protein BST96_04860 [Oceanicoccus sagamiensis]